MNDVVERVARNPGRYTEDGSVSLTDVCRGMVNAIMIARGELSKAAALRSPSIESEIERLGGGAV